MGPDPIKFTTTNIGSPKPAQQATDVPMIEGPQVQSTKKIPIPFETEKTVASEMVKNEATSTLSDIAHPKLTPPKALEGEDSKQLILKNIEEIEKSNKKLSKTKESNIRDAKGIAASVLQGTVAGAAAIEETVSTATGLIDLMHNAPLANQGIKAISAYAGQVASPILSGLKLASLPLEYLSLKNTKESLESYQEGLKHSLTKVRSDRQLVEELTTKLRDSSTEFDDIIKDFDWKFKQFADKTPVNYDTVKAEYPGMPDEMIHEFVNFNLAKLLYPKLSEEKIAEISSDKKKKKLLEKLDDSSFLSYMLEKRHDLISFPKRSHLINQFEIIQETSNTNDLVSMCMKLQKKYIHDFVKEEDFPNQNIDINDIKTIKHMAASQPYFKLQLKKRFEAFIEGLKTNPESIRNFNTRWCDHIERMRGMEQMIAERRAVAEKHLDALIKETQESLNNESADFEKIKQKFSHYGINLDEFDIKDLEDLKAYLSSDGALKALLPKFRDPAEPLSASARNGLKALATQKANNAIEFFKFSWLKAKIMMPLETFSSVFSLVFGIIILSTALAAPPLFLTILTSTVLGLGLVWGVVGFIHQLRYKPRTLFQNVIKLRSIRKWFRAARLKSIKSEMANKTKELRIEQLLQQAISVRLSERAFSEETKEALKSIEKDIPKSLRKMLFNDEISVKEQEKLTRRRDSCQAKIEQLTEDLRKGEIELAKREGELNVHIEALSEAGLKDAIHGGISFKKYLGFEPWEHENSTALGLVFPEFAADNNLAEPQAIINERIGEGEDKPPIHMPLGLIDALIQLETNQRLDDDTKNFLQKELNADLEMLKDAGKTRSELAQYFSGGGESIKELMAKRKRKT